MAATADQLAEAHRAAQATLGRRVIRQLMALWSLIDMDDIDRSSPRWLLLALGIVARQRRASMDLAASYYSGAHQLATGQPGRPVRAGADRDAVLTSLRVTGPVRTKEGIARGLSPSAAAGAAQVASARSGMRHVLDGGRQTVLASVEADDDVRGWARVGDGAPCAWCAMLISRGPVYLSSDEDSGGFRAHDGCGCQPVPVFGNDWPGREQYKAYQALWNRATPGHSGKDAIRAFRRAYEGQAAEHPRRKRPEEPSEEGGSEPEGEPESWVDQPTTAAVTEAFRQRWVPDPTQRYVDFAGLKPDVANAVARGLDDMMGRHPLTAGDLRILGSARGVKQAAEKIASRIHARIPRMPPRTYGQAFDQPLGMIRISNTGGRSTIDDWNQSLASDVEAGWHPPGTGSVEGVVRHEFGHFLDYRASALGGSDYHWWVNEIMRRHAREAGAPVSELLSRYALTNQKELMAEAVAEATTSPNPRPLASELYDLVVRYAEQPSQ